MNREATAIEATHAILFSSSDLSDEVGDNIHYARGPVTSQWPQVVYFAVTSRDSYIVDYDKNTIQVSSWAADKWQALRIHDILRRLFREYRGTVNTHYGDVKINWTELIDSSALPQDDDQLFGHQLRFELRVRGDNIGG